MSGRAPYGAAPNVSAEQRPKHNAALDGALKGVTGLASLIRRALHLRERYYSRGYYTVKRTGQRTVEVSCANGLICFEADAGGVRTCVSPREQGLSCRDDGDCARGLHCERPTCTANKANGQACRRDVECASAYCAGGTVCAEAPAEAPEDAWCAVAR